MALNYDFDMLTEAKSDGTVAPVALFRDAATVDALLRAPQAVQDYLRASMFGTRCHHSGAPAGRFPLADDDARIAVIEALAWNVGKFGLSAAGDGEAAPDTFDLAAFFAALAVAEPIAMTAAAPPTQIADTTSVVPEAEAAVLEPVIALPEVSTAASDAAPALTEPVVDVAEPDMAPLVDGAVRLDAEVAAPEADLTPPQDEAAAVEESAVAPLPVLILSNPILAGATPAAESPTDSLIAAMLTADPEPVSIVADPVVEAPTRADVAATPSAFADLNDDEPALAGDAATDDLIAQMLADDDPVSDAAATDIIINKVIAKEGTTDDDITADALIAADAAGQSLMQRGRFRLPRLPRWVSAGAAFAVIGVAFGSALI